MNTYADIQQYYFKLVGVIKAITGNSDLGSCQLQHHSICIKASERSLY